MAAGVTEACTKLKSAWKVAPRLSTQRRELKNAVEEVSEDSSAHRVHTCLEFDTVVEAFILWDVEQVTRRHLP